MSETTYGQEADTKHQLSIVKSAIAGMLFGSLVTGGALVFADTHESSSPTITEIEQEEDTDAIRLLLARVCRSLDIIHDEQLHPGPEPRPETDGIITATTTTQPPDDSIPLGIEERLPVVARNCFTS